MSRKAKEVKLHKENNKAYSGDKHNIDKKLKNTQEELALLKRRFNSLFERTSDAIIFTDLETMHFVIANQKAMDLFGFTKDELLKLNARDFIAKSDFEDSEKKLADLLRGKTLPTYERTFQKRSGELFQVEIDISLIIDHTTNKKLIQSIMRDITNRKKIEKAKDRERRVFKNIANAVIQTADLHEFCNRVLADLLREFDFNFGILRIIDMDLNALVPVAVIGLPDHLTNLLKPFGLSDETYIGSIAIKSKKPFFTGDARKEPLLKKYKTRLDLFETQSFIQWPILDKDNNIFGILHLSSKEIKVFEEEDIAFFDSIANMLTNTLERLRVELALKQLSDERKETIKIIELSPTIIFLWRNEENWPVEFVSKNVSLFGYDPDEFYSGKVNYRDIIHPEDLETDTSTLHDKYITPYTSPIEYRIITKDGSIKWVIEHLTPRLNRKGEITHYNGIVLDITKRRKQEEFLKRDRTTFKLVAEAAVQSKILEDLCQNILEVLISTLEFTEGLIRIYNQDTKLLKKIVGYNLVGPFTDFKDELHIDTEGLIVTHAARTKEPVFAPTLKDLAFSEDTVNRIKKLGIESFIAWPILSANKKLLGIIQLSSNQSKDFSEEDKILFASIANLFATALDRIYTEQALLQAYNDRKELDEIINLSPAIVFLWQNKEGWPVEFVSENVIFTFGYTPDDFYTGRVPYSAIIHPDDLDRIANEVATFSNDNEGEDYTQEYRIITKDGEIKWINDYTSLRRDDKGNITHYHGIVHDTTIRKRVEESLRNERKAFQIIAEATATANNLAELNQRILVGLSEALGFDIGSIRLFNEENQMLVPIASIGVKELTGREITPLSINDTYYINTLVGRTKEAIFAPDVTKHVSLKDHIDNLAKLNIKTVISWPILGSKNELIGVLYFASKKIKEIGEEDKIVFETITGSLVNAIERFHAEDARRESEQKFIAFAEQTLVGVFLFNSKGDILFKNKQAQIITEYPIEEIKELNMLELLLKIHPSYKSLISEDLNSFIERIPLSSVTQDFELITKSGKKKWVSINLTSIQLPKELIFASMLIDITSEKRAQLALNREQKILELISTATANSLSVVDLCQQILEGLISILDLDSGIVRLYDKSENSLNLIADYGIPEQENHQLTPISLDDDSNPLINIIKNKMKVFVTDVDKNQLTKNTEINKKFNYKVYISLPIFNNKYELQGTLQLGSKRSSNLYEEDKLFFESIADLFATAIEHLQVLENLSRSEDQFKRTVDTMADGIIIIENNEIVYVNDRALEIFGYPKDEFINEGHFFKYASDNLQLDINDIPEIVKSLSKCNEKIDYWTIQKNGTKRYITNSLFIESDENNEPIKLFVATTDITDRKLAEEALQKLNEELELRVTNRTEQLARVNRELEAFSYSVSHDLRSPLRSIDGFSKAILEDYSQIMDDTGKDYLNRVRAACLRMNELIDDMLNLSKLTRRELQYKEVNLSDLVNDILTRYQKNDPRQEVSIKIDENIVVYGDHSLLRAVMENLLGNAWKFTNKNKKTKIRFGLKIIDGKKVYYVQDNGVGFNMKYYDKLFLVFQRLHNYIEFKGTGVGLAIVQRIINRHGGRVWAESKTGKGATFYFTLQKK
ncbi:MAG: PAS domain S-box protein [Asgard group archaeon]|nr:PAS domain S-box protein [Asgard group archaeon]